MRRFIVILAILISALSLVGTRTQQTQASGPPAPIRLDHGNKVYDTKQLLATPGMTRTLVSTQKIKVVTSSGATTASTGPAPDIGVRQAGGETLYIWAQIYNISYYGAIFCSYGDAFGWGNPISPAFFSSSGTMTVNGYNYNAPRVGAYSRTASTATLCVRGPHNSFVFFTSYADGYWYNTGVYLNGNDFWSEIQY